MALDEQNTQKLIDGVAAALDSALDASSMNIDSATRARAHDANVLISKKLADAVRAFVMSADIDIIGLRTASSVPVSIVSGSSTLIGQTIASVSIDDASGKSAGKIR